MNGSRMEVAGMFDETAVAPRFDRLIGLNLFLLKLAGVISHGERSAKRIVLACLALGCMTVYSVSYCYDFFTRKPSLDSFSLILSFVGGQARFAILLVYRGSCQKMLTDCELLWSRLNRREKRVVKGYARKSSRLTLWYLFICASTIFFYILISLLGSWSSDESKAVDRGPKNTSGVSFDDTNGMDGMDRIDGMNDEAERQLPYAFLVEVRETPWYELTYLLQVVAVINIGFSYVGVDMTAPLFALIACGHFDVIRSRLETSRFVSSASFDEPRAKRMENLRVSLIHHRILLEFCEEIERTANAIFLTQLIISTYNVSLVGFKLVGDDPNKFAYITQLLISLIQLLLCNWPADLLLAKSESIASAAYFSPWYRDPVSLRLPTVMLLLRARKSARLTAGKFIILSLETFASMISTSASFFTVVKNMD